MNRLAQFFQPSLRRRILGSFILVTILVLMSVSISYYQLVQVREFSEQVSPTGQQMSQLQDFSISLSSLEASLEQIFILQGVEIEEEVFVELGTMSDILDSLQDQVILGTGATLSELVQAATQLESKVLVILGSPSANLSSTEINFGILEAYAEIDNVNQLHEQLTEETLAQLQSTAAQQQDIIAAVNQQSVAIGITIFIIVIVASLFIMRTLRPIADLTRTAQAIATGDLNRRAVVRSQDEIGTLAANFNIMAEQIQELIGGLEKRVADRTQALEMAAKVGSTVAQIRDLDELLDNAVEMIRSRFNLYYAQVYLVDEDNQKLRLRAGTGEVGKELVGRRFSLPLGPGSINSTAVYSKKPIIIVNTDKSAVFRPNPLLPETQSEMAVPMMIGDVVVGVLDLQSNQVNALSDKALPAFAALASQLAVAIENASLFTEVTRTRAEVEAQARRLVRDGWDNSLDGLHASEHIGFSYEEGDIHPLDKPLEAVKENGRFLSAPISIVGESVGTIQIEGAPDQIWTSEELELVNLIAQQVGQQVENLRLLNDAQRYREDAEKASRRLIRDGWSNFQEQSNIDGYLYNQKDVMPLQKIDNAMNDNDLFMQPLTIQGEIVGMLEVDGADGSDEETNVLITAVADQLSSHIDSLRLAAQTEQALGETAVQARRLAQLNEMGNALGAAHSREELFTTIPQHLSNIIKHDNLAITLVEPDGQTVATFMLSSESDPSLIRTASLLEGETAIGEAIKQQRAINIPDLHQVNFPEADDMLRFGLQSGLMIPLITARSTIGALTIGSKNMSAFTTQDENIMQQLAPLLASTIENQSLFAETQKEAEKERLVNVITQKIQRAMTVESALETAVQELGQALQTRHMQISLTSEMNDTITQP